MSNVSLIKNFSNYIIINYIKIIFSFFFFTIQYDTLYNLSKNHMLYQNLNCLPRRMSLSHTAIRWANPCQVQLNKYEK